MSTSVVGYGYVESWLDRLIPAEGTIDSRAPALLGPPDLVIDSDRARVAFAAKSAAERASRMVGGGSRPGSGGAGSRGVLNLGTFSTGFGDEAGRTREQGVPFQPLGLVSTSDGVLGVGLRAGFATET